MSIGSQVEKARQYCEQKGARFTHLRETVYALLLEKEGALKIPNTRSWVQLRGNS